MLGILMMRGVAQLFVTLLEKVPELEKSAYILIAIIGIKMLLTMVGIEVPELVFFGLLATVFGGTFIVHHFKKNTTNNQNA
jgi:predicted tellurium resistance membrane protein TerC